MPDKEFLSSLALSHGTTNMREASDSKTLLPKMPSTEFTQTAHWLYVFLKGPWHPCAVLWIPKQCEFLGFAQMRLPVFVVRENF